MTATEPQSTKAPTTYEERLDELCQYYRPKGVRPDDINVVALMQVAREFNKLAGDVVSDLNKMWLKTP